MIVMPETNELTDTDLKVIERLMQLGWKQGLFFTEIIYN